MAILEEKITAQILDQLHGDSPKEKWENCRQEHPWYPLPWLMIAETDAEKQKAALWFKNEHRIHWLFNKPTALGDEAPRSQPEESSDTEILRVEEKVQEVTETGEVATTDHQPIEIAEDQSPDVSLKPESEENIAIPDETPDEADENKETFAPISAEEELMQDDEPIVEKEEFAASETVTAAPEEIPAYTELSDDDVTNEEAPLKIKIDVDSENGKDPLVFEPLYTTDYFASQGIKVDLKAIPQTKFDQQVRTFTQWLKTMKRISPETNLPADPAVDAQATESLVEKDVVTEAMVAVLEKQGKYQKAIETLAKLILLHPEKSAFFAAQIENLKAKQ